MFMLELMFYISRNNVYIVPLPDDTNNTHM